MCVVFLPQFTDLKPEAWRDFSGSHGKEKTGMGSKVGVLDLALAALGLAGKGCVTLGVGRDLVLFTHR